MYGTNVIPSTLYDMNFISKPKKIFIMFENFLETLNFNVYLYQLKK